MLGKGGGVGNGDEDNTGTLQAGVSFFVSKM